MDSSSSIVELIIQAKDLTGNVLSRVQQSMTGIQNAGKGMKSSLKEVETVSERCQTAVSSVGGACVSLYGIILKLGVAMGGAGLVKSFIEINSSAERTKIMLGSLYGSTEKGNEVFRAIQEEATKIPFTLNAIQDSFVKLKSAGIEPTNGSFRVLADSVAMFGGSDEQLKGVMVAIQQMAGKGVISMEELRQQLGERIPTAIQAMATGLGYSADNLGEFYRAVGNQQISAATGINAMLTELNKLYGGQSQKMMTSWAGLVSNVKVEWEKLMISLGESGIFDKLKGMISGLLDKFSAWGKDGSVQAWLEKIIAAFDALWVIGQKTIGMLSVVYAYLNNTEVSKALPDALKAIRQALTWATEKGVAFIKWIGDLWSELEKSVAFGAFKLAVSDVITVISDLFNRIEEGFPKIGSLAGEHFGTAQRWIQAAVNVLTLLLSGLSGVIKTFVSFGEAIGQGAAVWEQYFYKLSDTLQILIFKISKYYEIVSSLGTADTSGYDAQIAALERHRAGIDANITAMLTYAPAAEKTKAATMGSVEANVRAAAAAEQVANGMDKAAESTKKSGKFMDDNKKSYEEWLAAIKPGTAQYIEMEESKLKASEKTAKATIAIYKQQYEEGIISARKYYDLVQQTEDEQYNAQLKSLNDRIEAAKQGGEKEYAQVAKYEAEKTALTAAHEAETQKLAAESTKAEEGELQQQVSNVEDANKQKDDSNRAVAKNQISFNRETLADSIMAADEFSSAWARAWGLILSYPGGYQKHMEQLDAAIQDKYKETIQTVKEAITGVTDAFAAIKSSGISSLNDAMGRMSDIRTKMRGDWKDFYNYMKDLGRGIAASVGMTAEEWIRKLADYIAYVKGLMQSLKETISSYQDQLDSLRGNDAAILEREYKRELQALDEKYGEDLKNTKEYHEAMLLLQQIYNEKKKRLEEEAAGKTDSGTSETGPGSSSSSSALAYTGGKLQTLPASLATMAAQNIATSMSAALGNMTAAITSSTDKYKKVLEENGFINKDGEMVVKKELLMGVTVDLKSDAPTAERFTKETLMPIIKRQLALEGITLK